MQTNLIRAIFILWDFSRSQQMWIADCTFKSEGGYTEVTIHIATLDKMKLLLCGRIIFRKTHNFSKATLFSCLRDSFEELSLAM